MAFVGHRTLNKWSVVCAWGLDLKRVISFGRNGRCFCFGGEFEEKSVAVDLINRAGFN